MLISEECLPFEEMLETNEQLATENVYLHIFHLSKVELRGTCERETSNSNN